MTSPPSISGTDRICAEYERRARTLPADQYSVTKVANLFAEQQRTRWLLRLLRQERLVPLEHRRILDVGCGDGWQLVQFEQWGAAAANLAGIDLMADRLNRAAARFPVHSGRDGPQLHRGDAASLPWPSDTIDIAYQSTVFSSMLDAAMERSAAREIVRVLKPGGVLLWYDLAVNNPANPAVRGMSSRTIRSLFPDCDVRLNRVTLAPPLARRLVPMTWMGSLLLEQLRLLNTHYVGVIRKRH